MILSTRVTLLLPAVVLAAAPASAGGSWAVHFLETRLGLHQDEIARLNRGEAVARMVEDPGGREIAVVGAVALSGPPVGWNADYPSVERLRSASPDFIAMGPLGRPPSREELERVELDPKIAVQLPRCRPGKCAMNASAADIERYGRLDGKGEDVVDRANGMFREILRERLACYQQSGDSALPVLANRRWTLTTADAPRLLLDRKPSLADLAPRVDARLRVFAEGGAPAADDVFFWVREKIWKREVVGLYHATFDDERVEGGRRRVVAEKLVWANHYLLGGLTVTGVLEDASGTYLFFLNRSETDNRGPFNFLQRALANRLLGGRLKRQMPGLREAVATSMSANRR